MARILGLDLGTNSLGWAVIDDEKKIIENTGVRIFPEGVEAKTIGTGDKEQSRNATRRDKRQIRRQFYRKRLRKIKLLEVLIAQNMCPLTIEELKKWKNWDRNKKTEGRTFPNSLEFTNWIKFNPYQLREKSLSEALTLHELGRIFYHIIQHRGFLSNRKGDDSNAKTIFEKGKPEENILPINATKEKIKNSSLGTYLNKIAYKEQQPYKTTTNENGVEIRIRGRYTTREMYVQEFEQIWQSQCRFLDLNTKTAEQLKSRELKGSLNGKRNKKRIDQLQKKYGINNVQVEKQQKSRISKVTTKCTISLKEFLAGKIEEVENIEGEKRLQFNSNESVLFWQRPLKSQKGLLSNCRFENKMPVIDARGHFRKDKNGDIIKRSKKPCPLSHPEFEIFRAYQFINNVKYGLNPKLTNDEKIKILNLINKNDKNFDFLKIPKELKLTYEKFNYDDKQKITGNYTIKHLSNLFSKEIWDKHYEEIWHCFYFYDDNEKLFKKLKRDFKYNKDVATLTKIKIKEGYSNISLKAIRNITPFLKMGYQFDRAVILGGVKNAFGKRWEYFKDFHSIIINDINRILNEDNKDGEAISKIKEYLAHPTNLYGFKENDPYFEHLYHHSQDITTCDTLNTYLPEVENLRNPIVQQGINETRRLVNSLVKQYQEKYGTDFHFDIIKVEMGRDLRNNKKGRQDINNKIKENETKNDEARERLAEFGLQPSRNNIQKYLMWKEIENKAGQAQCPYTGKTISINSLLGTDNAVQIEHIIPYSISLDDSFGNKTICESNFNNLKDEKTPYQFYKENSDSKLWGVNSWDEVEERAFHLLPYRKAKRFTAKKNFEKSTFIERQLNDSRYIAKKAAELLSYICNDVRVMPGQLTAELRHLWGLNNILQPVQNIDIQLLKNNKEENKSYYIVKDNNGHALSIHPKNNERPNTDSDEILLPFTVNKKEASSKYFGMTIETPELENGNYWAKFKTGKHIKLTKKFIDKPETDNDSIIFRGNIEKGIFKNESTGNISKTENDDGTYWAKFDIIDKNLISAENQKEQPKAKAKKQIVLFGNVFDGNFKCYIYTCNTDLPDGKYWLILDLDYTSIKFIKAINPRTTTSVNEICLLSSIDENNTMITDVDKQYCKTIIDTKGKYYTTIELKTKNPTFFPIANPAPKIETGQEIVEGLIWVDKYTGDIKFDPKKNRDDHRHHAIDAITIALTERSHLLHLSTYNAQRKKKSRGKLESTEKYQEPWENFYKDAVNAANSILISHKKNDKTLTKNKKGFCVRGQLHKENVFGKHQAPNQNEGFHRRTKLTELKNNKHLAKIVDPAIRKIVYNHLQKSYNININDPKGYNVPKDAFYKDGHWQLFLPNKNGDPVPIKKVRIKEKISNAAQLKSNLNQFVNPRNNHHVMIYKDYDENMQEDAVQFWTVIERVKSGESLYQLPPNGKEIIATLEINDMYLLDLSNEEFEYNKNNYNFLSKHLYRVQKISKGDYSFRYHLAANLENKKSEYRISSLKAWKKTNPIKIIITELGKIKQPC